MIILCSYSSLKRTVVIFINSFTGVRHVPIVANGKKGKVRWRMMLFYGFRSFCLSVMICAQFTGDTSSSFNDVKSFSLPVQTCGDFQYTDDDCRYDERWDQSDLHITNQTDTSGTVCRFSSMPSWRIREKSGLFLTGNGSSIKSLLSSSLYETAMLWIKGLLLIKSKTIYKIESKRSLQPGIYAFKVYKPEGYPTKKNLSGQNR